MPFVYAAAFAKGLFPGSLVEDSALDNRTVMIGGTTGILGEWGPESADNRYEGSITAREALVKSKNGAAVRIGTTAGLDSVTQLVHEAGVESKLRPYPATFLGSSEITLAELALAYTVFPNEGWRPPLAAYSRPDRGQTGPRCLAGRVRRQASARLETRNRV